MGTLQVHRDANARTLAAARIFILLCWFIKIATSDLMSLGYFSNELFHAHGLLKLVPTGLLTILTEPFSLQLLQWSLLGLITLSLFGIGRHAVLASLALLLTLQIGIAKGFGGHVNHRELVLLYTTYLLVGLPCFDALALRLGRFKEQTVLPQASYVASLQLLSFTILLPYFFIAVARLCVGFPGVFEPQVMYDWVLSRNVRPNPYEWGWGLTFLASDFGRLLLAIALPVSTLIELFAPLSLWCGKRSRVLVVVSLISFHLGIFFLMNIAFFENIALLLLLCDYTPLLSPSRDELTTCPTQDSCLPHLSNSKSLLPS